jgi:dTDP-4-amino-4,6-dideoxygalactose transaminase
VSLHSSTAGIKYGRVSGKMAVTDDISKRILRLPMYYEMCDEEIERVVEALEAFYLKR